MVSFFFAGSGKPFLENGDPDLPSSKLPDIYLKEVVDSFTSCNGSFWHEYLSTVSREKLLRSLRGESKHVVLGLTQLKEAILAFVHISLKSLGDRCHALGNRDVGMKITIAHNYYLSKVRYSSESGQLEVPAIRAKYSASRHT